MRKKGNSTDESWVEMSSSVGRYSSQCHEWESDGLRTLSVMLAPAAWFRRRNRLCVKELRHASIWLGFG